MADTQALPKPEFAGEVTGEIVAYAIEAANIARTAGGAEALPAEKLPFTEEVGDANHCVLAKLFNFECQIRPSGGGPSRGRNWYALIPKDAKAAAEALAAALGTDVQEGSFRYRVSLPEEVGIIAYTFDQQKLSADFVDVPEGTDSEYLA